MSKTVYIHPAVRNYRVGIFNLLSKKLHVKFFWSGESKPGTYVSDEVKRILQSTNVEYKQSKELKSFPLDNFSLCLLKLPFSQYDTFNFCLIKNRSQHLP